MSDPLVGDMKSSSLNDLKRVVHTVSPGERRDNREVELAIRKCRAYGASSEEVDAIVDEARPSRFRRFTTKDGS